MSKGTGILVAIGVAAGLAVTSQAPPEPQVQVVTSPDGSRQLQVPRSGDGHFYVHAMVNGQLVRFLVDTGATEIALTAEDAERVGVPFSPKSYQVVGTGASGPVRGQMIRIDSIELGGRQVSNLRGAVLDGLDVSLLGQSFLTRTGGVEMNADQMIIH